MPSRYMELIWSTATFRPSNSKIWSVSLVWFSNAMWYWNPEQPPPTTATRSATGEGFCIVMISLTLVLATGVRLIIIPLASGRGLRPRSFKYYSKPFDLLHGAAFQKRTRLETPLRSFLKKPRRVVYNVMHLW